MNSLSLELLEFRMGLARYSLPCARKRLEIERNGLKPSDSLLFAAVGSVPCDSRVPMGLAIDDQSNTVLIAGWSGELSIWNMKGEKLDSLNIHSDKVQCVDIKNQKILTGGFDSKVILSSPNPQEYQGHNGRVNSVIWSHLSDYFYSCSHDMTWKVWSTERTSSLMTQEGHGRGVFTISQHPDGGLLGSGDLSGIAALWDLRTGKHLMTFKDHTKKVLDSEFADNGYLFLTASEDNTVKIWDLRKKSLLYSIPAHSKLVSCLALSNSSIFSGSYDGTVKIWKLNDFSLVQTLNHNTKVTDLALDSSGEVLVSSNFDRTFKIWSAIH
jgi:U4/U6 small nuclear ribonucleoprotein PRP4